MDTYEKKYNEALERAKKYLSYDDADCDEGIKKVIRVILPELRDSEDEKIRIECIRAVQIAFADGDNKNRCIAWLEKQKEQKPVEKQDYSGLTDFERAIHRGFLCAGVGNVPVTIIKETAKECIDTLAKQEYGIPHFPFLNQPFYCDGTHCTNPHYDCVNCPGRKLPNSNVETVTKTDSK